MSPCSVFGSVGIHTCDTIYNGQMWGLERAEWTHLHERGAVRCGAVRCGAVRMPCWASLGPVACSVVT
jgi:L-lactate utilization protein LutB